MVLRTHSRSSGNISSNLSAEKMPSLKRLRVFGWKPLDGKTAEGGLLFLINRPASCLSLRGSGTRPTGGHLDPLQCCGRISHLDDYYDYDMIMITIMIIMIICFFLIWLFPLGCACHELQAVNYIFQSQFYRYNPGLGDLPLPGFFTTSNSWVPHI